MRFSDLKKSLIDGIKPAYLIFGQDAFLRENALRLLKDKALSEPDLNLNNFLGEEIKEDCVPFINALRSYPFISEKRYVVVKDYYPTQKELSQKLIKDALSDISETTVLIIVNENSKCDALLKNPLFTLVDCQKADDELIVRWVRAEAMKSQVIVSKQACDALIEYCHSDMTKISSELNKLLSFVGDKKEISESDVKEVVNKDSDYQIYELASSISKGDNNKTFKLLNEMLANNEDKQRLFISIYSHFRKLLHASIAKGTDKEIADLLNVKESALFMIKKQAKAFSTKRLKNICDKMSSYDGAFKSGEINVDSALLNGIFVAIMKG